MTHVEEVVVIIDKCCKDASEAVRGIPDGSTVLVSGFGEVGAPVHLISALVEQGTSELTVIANHAGSGDAGIGALFKAGRVRKIVCSYPRSSGSVWFERRYLAGEVELELVPQGTLSERIRAGGAGIGAFYTPTGVGTEMAEGKEVRCFDGREYLLELALRADVALVRAHVADRWGNLTYRSAARNYGPSMATAASLTIAEVATIVPLGEIDPEVVVTPGIFVDRVVATGAQR